MSPEHSSLEVRPRPGVPPDRLPPVLRHGPVLIASLEDALGPDEVIELYTTLHLAADSGLVTFTAGGVAELRPMAPGFRLAPLPQGRIALSRFAHVRRDGERLVVESPLSVASLGLLHPDALAVLWEIAAGGDADMIIARAADPGGARALLELLVSAGLAGPVEDDGVVGPDAPAALRQWEFHDLLFHSRSRQGRHDAELGGTLRFAGRLPPTPPLPTRSFPTTLALPRPVAPPRLDDGIAGLLGRRASVREQGLAPISRRELGELLHHATRVSEVVASPLGMVTRRPYASGGASYELEIYLVVDRCLGIAPGFYWYNAVAHGLAAIRKPDADTDALLDGACAASGTTRRPQILLAIAARFQRVSWKYAGIAYATILKDLGGVYATLYLVATAMGLAPCALGVGDSERFCRLAGTDRYSEATVGEFMIGSRP